MNLSEKIIEKVKSLPESKQAEVLDFIEFLHYRTSPTEWADFSLSSAMRGMENENSLYSLNDIKESFS
ncbi:MAG: DUF2281 domain-containing protein [Deltaproteobacteria bacterium]|jgi:hypothetical protein|nr:DUF2281 domain-containing protein [Deltaproteobacteria bacterium]MCL5879751.1 DUF2281 domain-containing protein [Deltaproteobacteria bacterium]MDA8304181.1 DUF2281 domain-containing protein [Deltaproteobacteria bacterium]